MDVEISMLHRLLNCDHDTGKLFWKTRTPDLFDEGKDGRDRNAAKWNSRFSGKEAICSASGSHGYLDGVILSRGVLAHRVVFAMTHGRWPIVVDHINGNRHDNRPANLREVTQAENMLNSKRRSDNPSGVAGVWQLRGSGLWRARIKASGVAHDLGTFETCDAAAAARALAMADLGFHPNHGRAA